MHRGRERESNRRRATLRPSTLMLTITHFMCDIAMTCINNTVGKFQLSNIKFANLLIHDYLGKGRYRTLPLPHDISEKVIIAPSSPPYRTLPVGTDYHGHKFRQVAT